MFFVCLYVIWGFIVSHQVIKQFSNQLAFLHGSLKVADEEVSPKAQNLRHVNTEPRCNSWALSY